MSTLSLDMQKYKTLAAKDVICSEQWPQSSRICFMFRNEPNPNFDKLHGKVYYICQVPATFFYKPVACQHELIHTIAYMIINISKICLFCWFQGAMVAEWPLWTRMTPTLSFSRFEFQIVDQNPGFTLVADWTYSTNLERSDLRSRSPTALCTFCIPNTLRITNHQERMEAILKEPRLIEVSVKSLKEGPDS